MKKWKHVCLGLALLLAVGDAFAQQSVVMRVNGREVSLGEFYLAYRCDSLQQETTRLEVSDFVPRFVNRKLRAMAAEEAGLDTLTDFKEAMASYRQQLAEVVWAKEAVAEGEARRLYDRMSQKHRPETICVEHIFKRLPQNVPGTVLCQVEARMDTIYNRLVQEGGAGFETYVQEFSDEKDTFCVRSLQMPIEFEDTVWALRPGSFSRPFFTPQGIHIVKVVARKEVAPFEKVRERLVLDNFRRQVQTSKVLPGGLQKRLEQAYHFTPDKKGMNELVCRGNTKRVLFTLNGKAYTGAEFSLCASAYPGGVRQQLDAFVVKSLLDCEYACMEQRGMTFGLQMQMHRDSLLACAIYDKEVTQKGISDEEALQKYFKAHQSDYYWDTPRYKGIVLHCVNRRTAKRVKKLLSQVPVNEWLDAVRLVFNDGERPKVQAEQGLFSLGENAFVDYHVFGGVKPERLRDFPYTTLFGKLMKGPDDYWEVRERLIADYRLYLEEQWQAALCAKGKVEINEEVLKTVNNSLR